MDNATDGDIARFTLVVIEATARPGRMLGLAHRVGPIAELDTPERGAVTVAVGPIAHDEADPARRVLRPIAPETSRLVAVGPIGG